MDTMCQTALSMLFLTKPSQAWHSLSTQTHGRRKWDTHLYAVMDVVVGLVMET